MPENKTILNYIAEYVYVFLLDLTFEKYFGSAPLTCG